jgi:hypothetical protein
MKTLACRGNARVLGLEPGPALARAIRERRAGRRHRRHPAGRALARDQRDLVPELAHAVRRVADGDAVFSPRLAGFVLDAFAGGPPVQEVYRQID